MYFRFSNISLARSGSWLGLVVPVVWISGSEEVNLNNLLPNSISLS